MKVYTNENNSLVYKILVSAEISKHEIECFHVSPDDSRFQAPRRLPVLELDSGNRLFSSNISALYLLPPTKTETKAVEEWLRWESSELMPCIVLIGSKQEPTEKLEKLLTKLNDSLQGKSHVVDELTVADICIWSALYPIFTDDKLKATFLGKNNNILSWCERLSTMKEFKDVVERSSYAKGSECLKSIMASCWYPTVTVTGKEKGSPTIESIKETALTEEDIKSAVDSWTGCKKAKLKPSQKPVLPKRGEKNIYITSALPYVNNVPHLGNIIGCVLSADVFARFCRLRNCNTLYICGTDEYGTATETKALEEGLTPQQICDKYFAIHDEIYKWFSISFDYFGRTTHPNQKEVVQKLFHSCHKNGYTCTESMDQLLCEKCDRFLADRFVEGTCPKCKFEDARGDQCDGCGNLINAIELIQPRCKVCSATPVVRQSEQLFLDLPKVEDKVAKWMEKASEGWTNNARVIAKAWLKTGLKPRCITRDLKWGVPVPLKGFESKVFYVWFDAPIGYMSLTKTYSDKWLEWWQPKADVDVKYYQFMAKDNVPFHSIMFPSTIMAVNEGYKLVDHLIATEYLNYEDGKFSKSRGVGVFGNNAKDTGIPSDIFRFYLLFVRPESQDSSFSWADMAMKCNSELLNNLGNFFNRALTFIEKFFGGAIPAVVVGDDERNLLGLISVELKSYVKSLEKCKLRDGIRYILNISRHGNQYMQSQQPWVLVKGSNAEKEKAGTVVGLCANMSALLAVLIQPYMPQTSQIMCGQLNLSAESVLIMDSFTPFLTQGHKIGKPSPLFKPIEQTLVNELKSKFGGKQEKEPQASSDSAPKSVAELQDAVTKQGEKVRQLKTSGAEKSVWQPEVKILLDLKKQLAAAQGTPAGPEKKSKASPPKTEPKANTVATSADPELAADLEKQVAAQGEKVRQLKASGADKSVWQPEVNILLELKKKLASAQGLPPQSDQSGKKKKK